MSFEFSDAAASLLKMLVGCAGGCARLPSGTDVPWNLPCEFGRPRYLPDYLCGVWKS